MISEIDKEGSGTARPHPNFVELPWSWTPVGWSQVTSDQFLEIMTTKWMEKDPKELLLKAFQL